MICSRRHLTIFYDVGRAVTWGCAAARDAPMRWTMAWLPVRRRKFSFIKFRIQIVFTYNGSTRYQMIPCTIERVMSFQNRIQPYGWIRFRRHWDSIALLSRAWRGLAWALYPPSHIGPHPLDPPRSLRTQSVVRSLALGVLWGVQ